MPEPIALPSRREAIARARARGQRVAAVLPIHAPRALLTACNVHSVEVWGPPGVDPEIGASHFQAYTCAIVRNATSFLLAGHLDDHDAVLIPHTCDAMQGMASVLVDFVRPKMPVLTLYLPRGRRASDETYLVAELRRLGRDLTALSGVAPTDEALHAALDREAAADDAVAGLWRDRAGLALSDRAFFTLLRTREFLDAEAFVEVARTAPRGERKQRGIPVMLSGIAPEPMEIFDALDEAGAHVVADDLAGVSRRIYPRVEEPDPFRRLARSLLGAAPDPTLGQPIPERVAMVRRRMEESGARGIVVYNPKFCEPELFYLPLLAKGLAEAGLPLLHVEHEMTESLGAQTRTRIEAFVETLRGAQ